MNLKIGAAVYQKEMLEIFRDKRTMISMVVVPLLAIPLLFSLINGFMTSREKEAQGEALTVGVSGGDKLPSVIQALKAAGFQPVAKLDPRAAVEKKEVAAAVDETEDAAGEKHLNVYIDRTRQASEIAG